MVSVIVLFLNHPGVSLSPKLLLSPVFKWVICFVFLLNLIPINPEAKTNASGVATFKVNQGGTYLVAASANGKAPQAAEVVIDGSATTASQAFNLVPFKARN